MKQRGASPRPMTALDRGSTTTGIYLRSQRRLFAWPQCWLAGKFNEI
jgi:hypothetical protein